MADKYLLHKRAGLLDAPEDTLPLDVWTSGDNGYTLRPTIKSYILSKLYEVVPQELIDKVFIIGSITGYKYKDSSDIDVNVYLRADVSKEDVKMYHLKMRPYNETLAPGTEHPVNFYISYAVSDEPFEYSKFGVYSVLEER